MAPSALSFNLDATLGAALIGFAASCLVYGIITVQAYEYYVKYPRDRTSYKLIVAAVWILETLHQVFVGHAVYWYTISNFGDALALIIQPVAWTLITQVTLGAIIGTIVKIAFAMRVWRFSGKNTPLAASLIALILLQLGLAGMYTWKAFVFRSFLKMPEFKLYATLALALGTATDILTAFALCYYLRKLRTGYSDDISDSLINSLTLYAVNTGLLTSVFSVVVLILYNTSPNNFMFMAFYFLLTKLYAVSLLATLNTRQMVRDRESNDAPHRRLPSQQIPDNFFHHTTTIGETVEVGIRKEVFVMCDRV